MKIYYKEQLKESPYQKGRVDHYFKSEKIEYCCEELKNSGICVFRNDEEYSNKPEFCIKTKEYRYREHEEDYYEIKYCPYCAEKIEYIKTKTVKVSERLEPYTVTQNLTRLVEEEVPIEN